MGGEFCKNLLPMQEWIETNDADSNAEGCPSCTLGIVSSWYLSELREQGQSGKADDLKKTIEKFSNKPIKIAKKLDEIKASVPEQIKDRLLDFDCSAQNFIKGG